MSKPENPITELLTNVATLVSDSGEHKRRLNAIDEKFAALELFNQSLVALKSELVAYKEFVASSFVAMDRAVTKADNAAEKRFDNVNEFRAALGDQQRNLMPRAEAEVLFKGLNEKLDSHFIAIDRRLAALVAERAEERGRSTGALSGWGWAAAIAGFILVIVSIVVAGATFFSYIAHTLKQP